VPRFKLTIEYSGTRYSGWQIQKNARTIQGEIDRAVRAVTDRKDFELYGSGRTDAGVHAAGQVAHLDVGTSLPPGALAARMNDELPADINILQAAIVPHRFHARHDAVARRYLYQIARRRTAFAKAYVWWIREPMDVDRMRDAAKALVGLRDFKAFADADAGPREPGSKMVLIDRVEIVEEGALVLVAVEGSHFLWKMVRRIVGVLVDIGRGRIAPGAIAGILADAAHGEGAGESKALVNPARLTAPPSGLFLERVYYPHDSRGTAVRAITPID
jgi:tRNA pseudouridine38-40 synthase